MRLLRCWRKRLQRNQELGGIPAFVQREIAQRRRNRLSGIEKSSKCVAVVAGYDESKPDCELDIEDLRQAAAFRGGELVSSSFEKGNLFQKLVWRCQDGHEFQLTAFSVLKAGHWCPECNKRYVWDYDRLAKSNEFYAQVWYDSHEKDEDCTYRLDENFNAHFKRNK